MKINKTIAVPRLRFPEFKSEGDWEDISLNDICHFVRGPFGGALKKDIFVEDGYAVYEQSHAIYGDFNSFRYFINKDKFNELKRFEVKENDLIMSCSGTMGKFSRIPTNPKKGVINQALLKLTVKKGFDTSFIKTALELPLNQNKLLSQSAGGAVKNVVGVKLIKQINIAIPDINEQQKIANCLSSLDTLIKAESEQLEALKSHKAGLLQQLFPADGETVPKLRFAEFEGDGNWEDISLNHICHFVRGPFGGALKKDIFVEEGYAVYEQSHAIYGDFNNFRYFIDEDKFNELQRFEVKQDDLIMSCSGTMGKFSRVPTNPKKGVINQALLKLTVKKGYDTSFIKTALELPLNQNKLLSQSAGGAVKNVVGVKLIKQINIAIPKIKEQQKIADCISSLDDLIQSKEDKIEVLKRHKQGLMQQLFPSNENLS